jgi:methylated-DNA-[protein]-cysteine S-methyltransferase
MVDAIYYDRMQDTIIGELFVALSGCGVLAIRIGGSEEEFAEWLSVKYGFQPRRSPDRAAQAIQQLAEYFSGERTSFEFSLDLTGLSDFQRRVLSVVANVPWGEVVTYGEIARQIGMPKSAQAVGQALAHNLLPIVIPCHRVVSANGALTGYSGGGGLKTKGILLHIEGSWLA